MKSPRAAERLILCLRRHIVDLDQFLQKYEQFHNANLEDPNEDLENWTRVAVTELAAMQEELLLLLTEYTQADDTTADEREELRILLKQALEKAQLALTQTRNIEKTARRHLSALNESLRQLRTTRNVMGEYRAGTDDSDRRFDAST